MAIHVTCPLCGNVISSSKDDCQSGGPAPDGCLLAQYGVRDDLRKLEQGAQKLVGTAAARP